MNNIEKIQFLIGQQLRELRLEAGYKSYEQFAFEKKISRIQYWKMENGSNFTLKSLLKILDAHEMSFEDFMKNFIVNSNHKSTQGNNLDFLIRASGLNKKDFALSLGQKNTSLINQVIYNNQNISTTFEKKIKEVYPKLYNKFFEKELSKNKLERKL